MEREVTVKIEEHQTRDRYSRNKLTNGIIEERNLRERLEPSGMLGLYIGNGCRDNLMMGQDLKSSLRHNFFFLRHN